MNQYKLRIWNNGTCKLTEVEVQQDTDSTLFLPTEKEADIDLHTVLGDFINTTILEGVSDGKKKYYETKSTAHPFFLGNELIYKSDKNQSTLQEQIDACHAFQEAIPNYLKTNHHQLCWYTTPHEIKRVIASVDNENLSSETLENIKVYYGLNFTTKVWYGLKQRPHEIFAWDFRFQKQSELNKDEISGYYYEYTCKDIAEIAFSVFFHQVTKGYKFSPCQHCGKYFATKTLKQKYCKRKSPYKSYEHKECEPAVKNIKKRQADRKKSVYDSFYSNIAYKNNQDRLNCFMGKCDVFKDDIKKLASVENLLKYDNYLYDPNLKVRWSRNAEKN